ncbi:hypothetical protein [Parvibaculum lavamentivorans]|nr:hypothetical protein [Parvibaculum lavamentivorans]
MSMMTTIQSSGFNRLERDFIPQAPGRAPAGAFGRRVFGRAAAAPAESLEVDRILARCRDRRAETLAPLPRRSSYRGNSEALAYVATGVSLLALSAISVLPIF